jgi:hypothetical protein
MVLAASSALSVLDEHSKSEHVAEIPADPEANPPDNCPKFLIIRCQNTTMDNNEDLWGEIK